MEHSDSRYPVKFHGKAGEFFSIWIVNILLSIVTLGIYSAWAKVRTKRYFYGNTEINGDSFEYHAKPTQILKGRLVAFFCVLIWSFANGFAPAFALFLMLAFYLLLPMLIHSNTRFDASVTSYKNVRFSFAGTLGSAYSVMLGRGLAAFCSIFVLIVVTSILWSASPIVGVLCSVLTFVAVIWLQAWVMCGISNYIANGYRYADQIFCTELDTKVFFKTYLLGGLITASGIAICMLLLYLTGVVSSDLFASGGFDSFGSRAGTLIAFIALYGAFLLSGLIGMAFVVSRIRNYTFSQLATFGEIQNEQVSYRFSSTLSTAGYVKLVATNFVLQVCTLGLARPWVMVRTQHYLANNTYVLGDLDKLDVFDKSTFDQSAVGDEIAEAFSVEIGIG